MTDLNNTIDIEDLGQNILTSLEAVTRLTRAPCCLLSSDTIDEIDALEASVVAYMGRQESAVEELEDKLAGVGLLANSYAQAEDVRAEAKRLNIELDENDIDDILSFLGKLLPAEDTLTNLIKDYGRVKLHELDK